MLSVRDYRRGRSKSPGGRERSTSRDHRDRSPDTRTKSPPRKENKKRRKKHSDSGPQDDSRPAQGEKLYQKYESDPDDPKSKSKKGSKRYSDGESEEPNQRHRKSTSKKYYDSDLDDRENAYKVEKRTPRRHDADQSESDRPREKSKKSSQRYHDSVSSEESPRRLHSHTSDRPKDKSMENHGDYGEGRHPGNPQVTQYVYAQPGQYMPGAPAGPAGPAGPAQTSHVSYVDPRHEHWREQWTSGPESQSPGFMTLPDAMPASPPYSAPGAFPIMPHTDVPNQPQIHPASGQNYMRPAQYQYASVDPNITYKPRNEKAYIRNPQPNYGAPSFIPSPHTQSVEVVPGAGKFEKHEKRYRYEDPASQKELAHHLARLAISGGAGAAAGVGAGLLVTSPSHGDRGRPPASPLLEAYHGTYQSISPMPSPMMLAKTKHSDSDSSELSDLDLSKKSKSRKESHKAKGIDVEPYRKHRPSNASTSGPDMVTATPRTPKRVSFYDPVSDAVKIASALAGTHHPPNTRPLISILPHLSTEDIHALRAEYKNHAKASGKGINMAKHIKVRVPGNLGKAAYVTALGRWESEAYWSNSWYQSGGTRRELLIESLMGRSNSDVREIKNCFRDKRYGDDLEKCMRAELKADKFRLAILLALQEMRMADSAALDVDLIARDVRDLHRALMSRDGGETAMIQIIVLRSDGHLREVLRAFEQTYHVNFAREMISKSRNLVGETLAHVLNGALNRPMRDALLLHQAIAETAPGKERAELLISRAVRLHWDGRHMEKVKRVYRERYGVDVAEALAREVWSGMKTREGREWVEFVAGCLDVDLDDYVRGGRKEIGDAGASKKDRRRSGGKDLEREVGYDTEERRPR